MVKANFCISQLMSWLLAVVIGICFSCTPTQRGDIDAVFSFETSLLGVSTVVDSLEVPWEIYLAADGQLWIAEQSGRVSRFDPETQTRKELLYLKDVYHIRTAGLLGMALYTEGEDTYVFVAYTAGENEDNRMSKLVRYTYVNDTLVSPLPMLEYPAWTGHFGTRLAIAPDGKLMVATGDGGQYENAQDIHVPLGKILRFNLDGSVPADNPIAGSPVWAWGLRNPQGLTFAPGGRLYNSDHGDAVADEVNRIIKGGNYGWPKVEGYVDEAPEKVFALDSTIQEPLRAWTPTIAPAGIAFYDSDAIPEFQNSILLTTLKGNGLHVLKLDETGNNVVSDTILFQQVFGRLRSIRVAPNGDVYIGTSNRDWNPNGFADAGDDRVIRLSKIPGSQIGSLRPTPAAVSNQTDVVSKGELLYSSYCASCHQDNGRGIPGTFPELYRSAMVTEDKDSLMGLTLSGKGEMPAFNFLDDKELAIVLSYVRKRFGPQASRVSTEEVSAHRITN